MAETKATVTEMALCHVIKGGNNILLIKSDEGVSKGKWNAPNGEIAKGEAPVKSAMRHVFQQTGLYVSKANYHGTVRLFLNGKNEYSYRIHVFSTKLFSGDLKPNIKGEAKWFAVSEVPYYEMWADDKYWINLVLQGKEFDADFFFDETNEKIVKYQIKERQKVLQKIILPVILVAVIGILIFGVVSIYGNAKKSSQGKTSTAKPIVLLPGGSSTIKNTSSSTSTTTVRTTTVNTSTTTILPPPPATITIDNINAFYNYSGPSYEGSQFCGQAARSEVLYAKRIFTGNTMFYMNQTVYSYGCNLTITRIYSTTPGFVVNKTVPALPLHLPPGSTQYIEIQLRTPNSTFVGPMSVTFNAR
ncbi:MAG: NUDIX domain-containing protein [Candidatus Micrarchaeota archaeon]|nr:NUDIX domain-containing protein [Candidatus Micrarchaeota archaeon]